MKRSFVLLSCVLAAGCDTRVTSSALDDRHRGTTPETLTESGPTQGPMPMSELTPPSLPPFATQTGNPPSATCAPAPVITSVDDCLAQSDQLRRRYAEPRQIRYVGADWMTDAIPFRIAEDPFSLSHCVSPDAAPRWVEPSTEPFCLCASALDDLTPAALGRFGSASDAGRAERECGHQRLLDDELAWKCIYARDEFPGCDPGVTDSCNDICELFKERAVAHYAATHDVQIRRSRFIPNPTNPCRSGSCELVFELAEQCFAERVSTHPCDSQRIVGPGQDCSLSDDELLTEAGSKPPPYVQDVGPLQCNAATPDAGPSDAATDAGEAEPGADSGTTGQRDAG